MLARLRGSAFLACAMLAGCEGRAEPQLRAAVQSMQVAFVNRDYASAWELLDVSSRDAFASQLHSLQDVPPNSIEEAAAEQALRPLGLQRTQLSGMDARQYFVATFESLDRAQPDVRRRQIEQTRTREIIDISITGDRATVQMREATGVTEAFQWIRESGDWKCVASSVGKGVERK